MVAQYKSRFNWTRRFPIFGPVIFSLLILLPMSIKAQDEKPDLPVLDTTSLPLNLLQVPSSPAFTILGIEPVSIERPTTPTDLAVCILQSTDNLISLPKNFALEFTPRWFFNTDNLTYDRYTDWINPLYVFPQTFSFSMATYTDTTVSADSFTTSFSTGIRFAVSRGWMDEKYNKKIDTLLGTLNRFISDEWDSTTTNDSILNSLKTLKNALHSRRTDLYGTLGSTSDEDSITLLNEEIKVVEDSIDLVGQKIEARDRQIIRELNETYEVKLDSSRTLIEESVEALHRKRIGLKINLALAAAWDFPQGVFDNSTLSKFGVWSNLGWECQNFGAFGTGRWMYDKLDPDSSSFNGGIRVIWDLPKELTLSGEAVVRYLYNPQEWHYRWDLNIDYPLFKNNVISLTVGKGYGQGFFEQGQLITSISFKQGFGSNRLRPVLVAEAKESTE